MSTGGTGFPDADSRDDFDRARRRRTLARLSSRLRRRPREVDEMLSFDEVVRALGRRGERRLGLRTIPVDAIVGSVDRSREFDRLFRPTSDRARDRWQRMAAAVRRGHAMPPIEVYKVGDLYFVVDGHHRVSVANALRRPTIDAYVTEILTDKPPPRAAARSSFIDRLRGRRGRR